MAAHTNPYPALCPDESGETTTTAFSPRLNALCSPKGVFKGTREEWMEAAAFIMHTWLNDALNMSTRTTYNRKKDSTKVVPLTMSLKKYLADSYGGKPGDYLFKPNQVRYACSLMGSIGGKNMSNALAHVHFKHATGNNHHEIRMGVQVGGRKTKDSSARVADILLHEMIHTMTPRCGHKGSFAIIARTMGLTGALTSTEASPALRDLIWSDVVTRLGKYPHAAVKLVPRGQRGKGSRSIKVQCQHCEFVMRTTRVWIDKAQGHMTCPLGCHHGSDDGMVIFGYEYKEESSTE